MWTWKITAIGSTGASYEGSAPTVAHGWARAVVAVMDAISAEEFDRCAIAVDDGPPAVLIAGRTEDGALDLPGTRAAAAKLAVSASGWPFG